MSPEDLAVSDASAGEGRAVTMTVVDVVTTGRPPAVVATVRIHNGGPVTARMRLFAVDDWSSAGPVPTEPSHLDLPAGRRGDVLVRTGRPWVRPFSRQRAGAVTVHADIGGEIVAGARYGARPVLSRVAVGAAAVVLLAVFGVVAVRPATDGVRYPLVVPEVTAEPADPPPPADPNALPADLVYDAAAGASVLVDRNRTVTVLPPGGRVTAAVKVPSGWVVARETGGVLHVRGNDVVDLAPGAGNPPFWVDGTGTRVLIDGRPGKLTVVSLPDGSRESVTDLPAHVRIVSWDALTVLVSVGGRYDRWLPGHPYLETPSQFAGSYLGAANGEVVLYLRDGTLDCILRVPDLFLPIGPALRCGFGVPVDGEALRGRWSAVSPGGRYAVMPGPNGSAFVAPLPAMLSGRAGFEPVTGLPGPITDLMWRDSATAAVLARGDDANIWTCTGAGRPCRPTALDAPAGLTTAHLVPRIPA
jgi:hypothetical protein